MDPATRVTNDESPNHHGATGAREALQRTDPRASEFNLLLRALPPADYAAFVAQSETVPLRLRQVLQEPHAPAEYVYFPQAGMVSTLVVLHDGTHVEAFTTGRDGLVPFMAAVGGDRTPTQTFSQLDGVAQRIAIDDYRALASPGSALQDIVHRYAQATFVQTAQGVACNRLHSVEQRCARWLLMTHDRVDGDTFALTHEFLATMLGVRRAGVSVAAETLQKDAVIRYARGRITVVDRAGLEAASCECYRAIRAEYERLIGTLEPRPVHGETPEGRDDAGVNGGG